jgi:uncharacterized membrane protein
MDPDPGDTDTADPPEPSSPPDRQPSQVPVIAELVAVVALGLTLIADVISRFVDKDVRFFHLGTALAVVAVAAAIIGVVASVAAQRGQSTGVDRSAWLLLAGSALLLVSIVLRFNYWDGSQGTPIRAIIPAAAAMVLLLLHAQAMVKARRTAQVPSDALP